MLRLFSAGRWAVAALVLAGLPAVSSAGTHGGIEIGAKGVKAIVLDFTPTPEGYDLTVRLSETTNTALSTGIAKTGQFDPADLAATADAVGKYAARMRARIDLKRRGDFEKSTLAAGSDTVYLCAADRDGNVVSVINSLFHGFGSGRIRVVSGTVDSRS